MKCYAEQQNLMKLDRGTSGAIPICVATLSGFFVGDKIMICQVCGNLIPKENWWRKPKYCCWECYQVAHKALKEKRICLFCKRVFTIQKCFRKNYCSKKCRYAAQINIGHKYIGGNGYWYIKVSPRKYELEHRLIAESILKRPLTDEENIHHINGIKTDNRPENIAIFESNSAHVKFHAENTPLWGTKAALNWGVQYLEIRL